MKAIQIKYLPATNTKGVRLKVFTDAGSQTESRNYEGEPSEQARSMARQYAKTYFNCDITGFGTLPNGDWVATIQQVSYSIHSQSN